MFYLTVFTVLLHSLTFSKSVRSAVTNVQCRASFEPEVIIVKKFINQTHQNIRCAAEISSDNFTKPIFELSFGMSPSTGVFLLRGDTKCATDGLRCWSDFKVFSFALRQLLLEAAREDASGDDSDPLLMSHSSSNSPSIRSSQIEFTCNVADAWRNKRISCSQSATIKFANVLTYGQKCAVSSGAESECAVNMDCLAGRCVCKAGFIPHKLSRREYLCLDKVSLGEKCNFTQQCVSKHANTVCEHDPALTQRICKCLSGYQEVKGENGEYHCVKMAVSPLQTPTVQLPHQTSTTIMAGAASTNNNNNNNNNQFATSTNNQTNSQSASSRSASSVSTSTASTSESITDFELFDTIDDEHSNGDLRSMALGLAKSPHFILIAGGLIVFLTVFIIAVAIRSRNFGEMKVKKKNAKLVQKGGNGGGDSSSESPPLLGLVNKVGSVDTDETHDLERGDTPTDDGDDDDEARNDYDEASTHRGDSPFLSFESDDISNLHSKQSTV